ncbi:MAG: chromosome segregation protein SMC [Planctomycetaceae bacterium]|nr:chromosome segregation protein SMC [Planctomycetaceae bacterium]
MLKAIELSGFKSFADRTRIEFGRGITAIVGPNGSGKSNIVDAIKWVLGEQSMKRLRGSESTDVIFNGSADRTPLGSAEVTLTFDNSKKLFNIDTPEVHITRRIYRSNETEYQINRNTTRLKDIKDLLNGTGLGTQAYSIIEQGRVESLLQSTPLQRRTIFEEAAGISRFNTRKQEIQRRLERINQNLVRLSDIVSELDHQLKSARNQAGKAQLHRQYTARLKEIRIQSGLIEYRKKEKKIKELQSEIDILTNNIEKQNNNSELNENLLASVNIDIEQIDNEIRKLESETATLRERIAGDESTIEMQWEQINDINSQINANWDSLTELNGRSTDTEDMMRKTNDDIHNAKRTKKEINETYHNLQREDKELADLCEKLQSELDGIGVDTDTKNRQAANLAGTTGGLESRIASQKNTIEQNNTKQEKLKSQLKELHSNQTELQNTIENIEDTVKQKKEELQNIRQQKNKRIDDLAKLTHNLSELKQRQSGMRERISVLEDLINKNEGISPGVREVLQQSHDPKSPFRHVFGLVADLLHAEVESASLIDLALGQNSQYVVVSPKGELFRHIERNAAQFAGRVGFIWLDPSEEDPPWVKGRGFLGRQGVYGRADQFVKADEPFIHLARRLLGKTWIVENMAVAVQLYKESNDQASFLTIAGELLTTDGALIVGPPNTSSGLIARRSELRNLTTQMNSLDADVQEMEIAVVIAKEHLENDEKDVEKKNREYQKNISNYESLQQKLLNIEERIKNNNEQINTINDEIEKQNSTLHEITTELTKTEQKQKTIEQELNLLKQRQEDIRNRLEDAKSRQTEHRKKTMNTQIELATSEERLRSLFELKQRYEDSLVERQNQLNERQQRSMMLESKRENFLLTILKIEAELASLYIRKEAAEKDTAKNTKERNEIAEKRNKLQTENKKLRTELQDLRKKEHSRRIEIERFTQEQKTSIDRIKEDYNIDLIDIHLAEINNPNHNKTDKNELDNNTATNTSVDNTIDNKSDQTANNPQNEKSTSKNELPIDSCGVGGGELGADYKSEIEELRSKLQRLGNVNTDAIETLDELETRYNVLSGQYNDLNNAKRSVERAIEQINTSSRSLFEETFNGVRSHFIDLFQHLFGGGSADIVLEDPSNMLESGVDIVAKPPGKELKSVMLMSGGEKTMTCVALLLAFFRYKPNPVCILDECDAALDEGNVDRFLRTIKQFETETQFIMITHSRKSMSIVTTMHGITMHEAGVSKLASVEFRNITEQGEIKEPATAA